MKYTACPKPVSTTLYSTRACLWDYEKQNRAANPDPDRGFRINFTLYPDPIILQDFLIWLYWKDDDQTSTNVLKCYIFCQVMSLKIFKMETRKNYIKEKEPEPDPT